MKPSNLTVFELFERQQRYVVPLFQRSYVWTKEKQWVPLWEDISAKAEEIIGNQQNVHREPSNHFMGAIVLNPIKTTGIQVTAKSIVDGQQRLTTLQIILIAMRDFMRIHNNEDFLSTIELHTENKCKMADPIEKYKVWPTNSDRKVFEAITNAGSPESLRKEFPPIRKKFHRYPEPLPSLIEAYLYFYKSIESFVNIDNNDDGEFTKQDQSERLAALVGAFKRHLEIVTIDLDESDNPQAIFETLNFRGEPLLPSDLIRNFVFLEASRNSKAVEDLYNKYWLPYDQPGPNGEINFWKELEKQGRIERQRMELFVFHYLVFQTAEDIYITKLYQEFRDWWMKEERNISTELMRLQNNSEIFRQFYSHEIVTRKDIFLRRLRLLDVTTVYPLLLFLLNINEKELPKTELEGIFIDLESFLVRRLICGLTTKNYNNIFISLLKNLKKAEKVDRATVQSLLVGPTGNSARWPDDSELENAWFSRPVYQTLGHRTRMILEAIDIQMRTKKQEGAYGNLGQLTIEHIMPQAWQAHYPLPVELNPEERNIAVLNRNNIIHTFGNLTLLTMELNDQIKNGPFNIKHREIVHQSELRLNAELNKLPHPLIWDESSIVDRGKRMLSIAIGIWPYPEKNS